MAKHEVTDLLERDLRREGLAGIRIEGLLAVVDETGYRGEPHLEVLGEVVSSQGDRFPSDTRIQFVALNDRDQVVGVLSTSVTGGDPGYEAFDEGTGLQGLPARIRVVTSSR